MTYYTSYFVSELHVELKPDSDGTWILTMDLVYRSKSLGAEITVPAGFETDFASVPRIPIIYGAWGDRAHREAVLHDYLYRKNALPALSFNKCNSVFLEAMESRGVPWYIRYPMYFGVCIGGHPSYKRR